MIEDLKIVEKSFFDFNGNDYNEIKRYFLRNTDGEIVSHGYNGMSYLGNDCMLFVI